MKIKEIESRKKLRVWYSLYYKYLDKSLPLGYKFLEMGKFSKHLYNYNAWLALVLNKSMDVFPKNIFPKDIFQNQIRCCLPSHEQILQYKWRTTALYVKTENEF